MGRKKKMKYSPKKPSINVSSNMPNGIDSLQFILKYNEAIGSTSKVIKELQRPNIVIGHLSRFKCPKFKANEVQSQIKKAVKEVNTRDSYNDIQLTNTIACCGEFKSDAVYTTFELATWSYWESGFWIFKWKNPKLPRIQKSQHESVSDRV